MFEALDLEKLSQRLAEATPAGLRHLRDDMQKSFHAILQGTLARMDLVSREDFEVQREVLARTRAKLELLEAQVAELEKRLASP